MLLGVKSFFVGRVSGFSFFSHNPRRVCSCERYSFFSRKTRNSFFHLEVAVDDPPVVHRLQRHHDLGRVGTRGGLGQPPARAEVPEELAAADELEREVDVGRVLFCFFELFFRFEDAWYLCLSGARATKESGERKKEKRWRGQGKRFPLFLSSSRGLEGERSLSLFHSFLCNHQPTNLPKLTWNVASSLTNAGSPLRLPSTSFSESK